MHRFTGTFGKNTDGTRSLYFDGSDVGFDTRRDDINAMSTEAASHFLFSTAGAYAAAGGTGDDDGVSRITGTFGEITTGTAGREPDGSVLGLTPTSTSTPSTVLPEADVLGE